MSKILSARKVTPRLIQEIGLLREQGLSYKKIGEELNINPSTAHRNDPGAPFNMPGNTKYEKQKLIKHVVRLRNRGMYWREIAKHVGVSVSTASRWYDEQQK